MERLSDKAIEIINALHTERLDYESEYLPLIECAQKLGAYEDTWLEPEEIELTKEAQDITENMSPQRLAEILGAEKAGRLVVLQDGKATWIKAILAERDRQDKKWGYPQKNTYCEWASILAEETGELAKELNELNFGGGDVRRMEAEVVQVAAVALSILEQSMVAHQTTVKAVDEIGRLHSKEAEEALRKEGTE